MTCRQGRHCTMGGMDRMVTPVVVAGILLAGCSTPAVPSAPADPDPSAAAPASAPATVTASPTPTPSGTPNPLPTIPPPLPNEIVRSTFDGAAARNASATHSFVGQVVSVHVLCTTHDGQVAVTLLVDGVERFTGTTPCFEAVTTFEDATFDAGTHDVTLEVRPGGGASGVAYLLEGDI